ncbi:ferritin family protein [Candidatus Bathyarchaeota archaeon]|nr:ferritin family protein [Candidatus Bathyarchaeota archaeon]
MNIENWTIEKALKVGAEMELESYTLYTETAEKSTYPGAKKLLTELASDEKRHREYFLQGLKDPKNVKMRTLKENIPDLKITDKLVKVPLDPQADYPQILIYAAQREKTTHDFYVQVARKFSDTELGKMFNNFAKEELRHKYLLEKEYDDVVLAEM